MDIIPHKRCSKCGADKPLTEFHKSKREPDGYKSWCKACRKLESKVYYWQDPDMQRAKLRQRRESKPGYGKIALRQPYYCSRCDRVLTATDFVIDRGRRFGHYPFCKSCCKKERHQSRDKNRARVRKHYARNRDRYIERARIWNENNPKKRQSTSRMYSRRRRAWKRGSAGTFTQQEWTALCEYYDNRCLRCGKQAPEILLTPDHVVPLSRGGGNTIDNIQPLCRICNTSKNAKTIDYRKTWAHKASNLKDQSSGQSRSGE